eukprot:sb/3472540/
MNSTTIEDVLAIIENIPLSQSRSSVEILAILHSLTSQTAVVKVSSRVSDLATEAYAASGENSQHYAEECALLTWAVMENLLKIAIPEGSASGVEETSQVKSFETHFSRRTTQPFWLIQSLSDRPCQGHWGWVWGRDWDELGIEIKTYMGWSYGCLILGPAQQGT